MNESKPLEGVRVLDFCVVWAGTYATMLLGDLGAEVIKPENPFVLQPMTRLMRRNITQTMLDNSIAWQGGFPNNEPGDRPWNYWPNSISLYRNKKSFSVDQRTPEGKDIIRRLVEKCDVVYENNAFGTMEKFGITYEWLKEIKPDIIFVRVPAYGLTGPNREMRALGLHLEAMIGHTLLRGYPDRDPSANSPVYAGDYIAGTQGAFAVMAALWHRRRTGRGQMIELSQVENATSMFPQAMMDYRLNGRIQSTIGNRDVLGGHPCGVYPARSPGSAEDQGDHWIGIHIESDEMWQAFASLIGEEWAEAPRFSTNDGRAQHADELDQLIAGWTSKYEDYDLMHLLQRNGVNAAPILEASRMFDDPHLRSREFFRTQRIENGESYEFVGPLWSFPDTPVEFYQGPVGFGEHNDYVYRELLGVSDDEYESLKAAGHITMDLDPNIP